MIINGKEITFFMSQKKTPPQYYLILQREIRLSLNALFFVKNIKYVNSKSTNSIYFTFNITGSSIPITISIRTHPPKKVMKNYIYFYIPNYSHLSDLIYDIQLKTTAVYNDFSKERNGKIANLPTKTNLYNKKITQKKRNKIKKLKGTATELKNVQQGSFESLMNEFNKDHHV